MPAKKTEEIDLLLSTLDEKQIHEFIKQECDNNSHFRNRFLAFGASSVSAKSAARLTADFYTATVEELMEKYCERKGYITYRDIFAFSQEVFQVLEQAEEAIRNQQWDVATAVVLGVMAAGDDIISCGDDSGGELSSILSGCFEMLGSLCNAGELSDERRSELFKHVINCFSEKKLKGTDWWWDWIDNAISLADTPDRQATIIKLLDDVINTADKEKWNSRYDVSTAQKYKLKVLSKTGSHEEQIKFMCDNVGNPDFRKQLLQMAWDNKNYEEVLRLAKEGVAHDSELLGLVSDWHKWELKVYRQIGDKANILRLSRHFFFEGGGWGQREYSMEAMYSQMKSVVSEDEWSKYVETLINDAMKKRNDSTRLLFVYTQEKMWDRYMDYLRKTPSVYNLDDAPKKVRVLYKEEFISLYVSCVNQYFQNASNRNEYSIGVGMLKKLIGYGGEAEAYKIAEEQKVRRPRRPAMIDELSRLH